MAFQKHKNNPNLGKEVREHLTSLGLETPLVSEKLDVDNKTKIDILEKNFQNIWETLGYDMSDDSLVDTPKRMAKMWVLETMWGLQEDNFPKCTVVENKFNADEMVCVKDITIMSNCEHHGVVIDGVCAIAYIPKRNVLGLSKLNRVANYFAARAQVQERLTSQIHAALCYILDTEDVAVLMDAEHYCVKSRGVEDTTSSTVTSKLSGAFKNDPATRQEFMSIAREQ